MWGWPNGCTRCWCILHGEANTGYGSAYGFGFWYFTELLLVSFCLFVSFIFVPAFFFSFRAHWVFQFAFVYSIFFHLPNLVYVDSMFSLLNLSPYVYNFFFPLESARMVVVSQCPTVVVLHNPHKKARLDIYIIGNTSIFRQAAIISTLADFIGSKLGRERWGSETHTNTHTKSERQRKRERERAPFVNWKMKQNYDANSRNQIHHSWSWILIKWTGSGNNITRQLTSGTINGPCTLFTNSDNRTQCLQRASMFNKSEEIN